MKKIAVALFAVLSAATPALANPFRYETTCYWKIEDAVYKVDEKCVVIETREKGGALKTRNIFSNKFPMTIKMWWDSKANKFFQTDSHNKFVYHWEYKASPDLQKDGIAATEVLPSVFVHNISWD